MMTGLVDIVPLNFAIYTEIFISHFDMNIWVYSRVSCNY